MDTRNNENNENNDDAFVKLTSLLFFGLTLKAVIPVVFFFFVVLLR